MTDRQPAPAVESAKQPQPELTISGVYQEMIELGGGNAIDLVLDAALAHIVSLRRERLALIERIHAAERAPLEARIAELDTANNALDTMVSELQSGYYASREICDAALAWAQRAEETLREIATTTVGGGGDRIAQHLRDVASRALRAQPPGPERAPDPPWKRHA